MDVPSTGSSPLNAVNLQTLVSVIQNAVQAQNLIATNIAKLTAATTSLVTAVQAQTTAYNNAFPPPLSSSASWTPGAILTGAEASTTVTVAGAALGTFVKASFSLSVSALTLSAYVSAANTVTVVLANNTGSTVTLGAGTLKVSVTTG